MQADPGKFIKAHPGRIFIWSIALFLLLLTPLALAFNGLQPASATAQSAPNADAHTITWSDPGGSGRQVSFTTVYSYGSCVSVSDRIYTTGIPDNWNLNGNLNVDIVLSGGGRQLVQNYPIAQTGNLDFTVPYPPAWTWTFMTDANLREIHVDINILVTDENGQVVSWIGDSSGVGVLGPGQPWDVYCPIPNPAPQLSIVKTTNGADANDPNGSDVPRIAVGDSVIWAYQVTNTGVWPIAREYITVSDDQTGVTPVFDQVITGNADTILDPAEVWQYIATGTAVNLDSPPAGVIFQQNACTINGSQPARNAYINTGTVTIPGVTASDVSSYCNPSSPGITIIKYTNGQQANNPNGPDVPLIQPGAVVTWTYRVTNTGGTTIARANVNVSDDQTGVLPAFDQEISGNGDTNFDPEEVWQYKAAGIAVDLSNPPAGVKTAPNACTMNGTQPPRTAYINQGTVTIPGASDTAQSSYCNPPVPGITIVKYTNGFLANDPNGVDVPQLKPGVAVTWTYRVTNTGQIAFARNEVVVTDNQPGVTPAFDQEITGNGDTILGPGEVWLYKATGTVIDTTLPPQGVTIIREACSYQNTEPPSPAYVNTGTVTVPNATASAISSYCNPLHYPYFGENGYLGIEDWINGDYDYNDFGFYFRIEETTVWSCPGDVCGPYLTNVTVTTTAKVFDSGMRHLIHLHRVFNGGVHYSVTRSAAPFANDLVLFDGSSGRETPVGNYTSLSGDVDVTLYNTNRYTYPQKLINETVVVDFIIDNPLLNPRVPGTSVRSYTVGSTTFTDLDPIMSQYDFWEEGTQYQSRWHLKDTHPIEETFDQILVPGARILPVGTVLPFMIVVPYTDWIPPYESTTISSPYASFRDFYLTGSPADWYIPARVTNNCVIPTGISWGPYPGASSCHYVFMPITTK